MSSERLAEQVSDWRGSGFSVDRDQRLVCGVALAGLQSKNGYRYTEDALRGAVPLYEGRPVFLDHASNSQKPHERSARDLVGSIRRTRFEAGRVRGDIEVLETESGRTFLALAESNTDSVGMSHVVLAVRSGDKQLVERIEEVISVDAVMFPATTLTFQEQTRDDGHDDLVPGSYEEILVLMDEALSQLETEETRISTFEDYVVTQVANEQDEGEYVVRAWTKEDSGEISLSEELGRISPEALMDGTWREELSGEETSESENMLGRRKNQQFKLQERHQRLLRKYVELRKKTLGGNRVESLLQEACLPEEAITAEFRELLKDAGAEIQKLLLEDRKKLCRLLEKRKPCSARRACSNLLPAEDERFIRGVKGIH